MPINPEGKTIIEVLNLPREKHEEDRADILCVAALGERSHARLGEIFQDLYDKLQLGQRPREEWAAATWELCNAIWRQNIRADIDETSKELPAPMFPLGAVTFTPKLWTTIPADRLGQYIEKHGQCDHGLISEVDEIENLYSMREGGPIISEYPDDEGVIFVRTDEHGTIAMMRDEDKWSTDRIIDHDDLPF